MRRVCRVGLDETASNRNGRMLIIMLLETSRKGREWGREAD